MSEAKWASRQRAWSAPQWRATALTLRSFCESFLVDFITLWKSPSDWRRLSFSSRRSAAARNAATSSSRSSSIFSCVLVMYATASIFARAARASASATRASHFSCIWASSASWRSATLLLLWWLLLPWARSWPRARGCFGTAARRVRRCFFSAGAADDDALFSCCASASSSSSSATEPMLERLPALPVLLRPPLARFALREPRCRRPEPRLALPRSRFRANLPSAPRRRPLRSCVASAASAAGRASTITVFDVIDACFSVASASS